MPANLHGFHFPVHFFPNEVALPSITPASILSRTAFPNIAVIAPHVATLKPRHTYLPLLMCQVKTCDCNLQKAAGPNTGIAPTHKNHKWRSPMTIALCCTSTLLHFSFMLLCCVLFLFPHSCHLFSALYFIFLSSLSLHLSSTFASALKIRCCVICFHLCFVCLSSSSIILDLSNLMFSFPNFLSLISPFTWPSTDDSLREKPLIFQVFSTSLVLTLINHFVGSFESAVSSLLGGVTPIFKIRQTVNNCSPVFLRF